MIDIGKKKITKRKAIAEGTIILDKKIIEDIKKQKIPKGDVLNISKASALVAIKHTPLLIPFCHPVKITKGDITFEIFDDRIKVICEVEGIDRTGFEMEALVGVCICLLTIYDMCKVYKKEMEFSRIRIIEKRK
ncbi:MAG: cyclic pyranopterin monophosphate synthase MoaC [Candidatus Omnitrophica bacterium]|nr:cyclic pyranopterin monophosphate synthase MoaC [Candidatus Omnitrophota bacterium]